MKKEIRVNVEEAIWKLKLVIRQAVMTNIFGGYKSAFKGKGLEFDYYRDYSPGEDASLIDWKASTRAKKLLVKKYIEERELDVFFMIDVSSSMVFGSTPQLKNEYVAELVISLAYLIMEAGDRVGIALFNDKIFSVTPLNRGKKHFYRIAKILTNPDVYGGRYDLNVVDFPLKFLKRKGAVVFIISDFIGLKDESWSIKLKWLSTQFDVICVMVHDPRDEELIDAGTVYIQDPFSTRRMLIDPYSIAQTYEAVTRKGEERIRQLVRDARTDFVKLRTDKPFVKPFVEFFRRRRKRWK